MSKIDLTTADWRELVFVGRNKEYGAYVLRGKSDKRHNVAVIIIITATILIFSAPKLIELATPKKAREVVTEVTTLSKLDKAAEVKQDLKKPVSMEPPPQVKSSIKFVAPIIKKDEEVKEENEIKSQEEVNNAKSSISIADVVGDNENGVDIADVKVAITQVEEEKIFEVIEQMPTFPGGESELLSYLGKNVRYPVAALENNIQGRVILRFVVTKNGDIDRVEVVRSLDPSCDREALRVVKSLPRWIPGKQNGENVSVWFTLPINFKIQ